MSEKWYCPQCGPDVDAEYEDDCDVYVCIECGGDCEDTAPIFVLAMQQRITELEQEYSRCYEDYTVSEKQLAWCTKRIKTLEAALFNTVTELESWNLTEGDLESVVVIKAAKDALRAAGYPVGGEGQ